MQESWLRLLGQEDPLEKEMATHSSILAWEIPWTEESGGLPSMGLQKRQDGLNNNSHRHLWEASCPQYSVSTPISIKVVQNGPSPKWDKFKPHWAHGRTGLLLWLWPRTLTVGGAGRAHRLLTFARELALDESLEYPAPQSPGPYGMDDGCNNCNKLT